MTIAALAKESADKARAELIAAIWSNAEPRQLLALSVAAALTPDDADELARLIEGLRSNEALGAQSSALRSAAAKARTAFERKRGELQAQIDRLESQIGDLAYAVQDAERQASQAETASQMVIRGWYDGLVPASHPFVQAHLAHEQKDRAALETERALRGRVQTALSALQANVDTLRRWRDRKNDLLANRVMEQSEGYESWTVQRCTEEIAKGPAAIAAARKALTVAIAAACAAGLVVPDAPPAEQDEA